jgi:hypothetical protein
LLGATFFKDKKNLLGYGIGFGDLNIPNTPFSHSNWRKTKEDKKVRFNEEETGQEPRKELPFKDVPPVEFSDRNKEHISGSQHDTVSEIASGPAPDKVNSIFPTGTFSAGTASGKIFPSQVRNQRRGSVSRSRSASCHMGLVKKGLKGRHLSGTGLVELDS